MSVALDLVTLQQGKLWQLVSWCLSAPSIVSGYVIRRPPVTFFLKGTTDRGLTASWCRAPRPDVFQSTQVSLASFQKPSASATAYGRLSLM
ncbi:hypothetical protein FPV67DRAFT_396003 [Lyophyllum atratum]|nr:hypothetical protein FPV67DRAFT_396003 [Lyophyllum atratum]